MSKKKRSELRKDTGRIKLIKDLMKSKSVKGNPRNYIAITNGKYIVDVSGTYEIVSTLPQNINPGNHVWVREYIENKEKMECLIVLKDEGEKLLVTDEDETYEKYISRIECQSLPITIRTMLLHKKNINLILGDKWASIFWNFKLNKRNVRPELRCANG